ncbi:hypothetical protein AVEN_167332-1 [Araneus ventricosus]|uniref:Uncharacterized protein n=1 Tax=Araneus ventricosus TaxID=182803 RepID=A0A4Y2DC43_ARAVE|nr:hypothetical protein AVEN_167332-1 [Araneus ventricosus]
MVPTRWRSSAQGIKCTTVHLGHIAAASHRVWWLRRMTSTFTCPEPIGLFSVGIHQTASVRNPSTNVAGTSKPYYGFLCQPVTCHVAHCAEGSAVSCPDVYCC